MDILKSNPSSEDEERNCRSLVNLKSSTQWLEHWSWHTSNGDERDGRGYDSFSLFLEMEDNSLAKTMGTLTPNGVFIGFPIGLKWLEPTKGLGHLI